MFRPRVMPCLLLHRRGLVKTRGFADPVYLGDPVNTVRIFSDKEVDELVVLDIDAARGAEPDYATLAAMAGECFMPLAYGGGVRSLEQVRRLIRCGVEKVIVTGAAADNPGLVHEVAEVFGSQAVVGGLELRARDGGWDLSCQGGRRRLDVPLDEQVDRLIAAGAGELLLHSADRDGRRAGYDLDLIRHVSARVPVPVVACGGAGSVEHLRQAVQAGAAAVAAGSLFVFHGRHQAVLIHYPGADALKTLG
jgi:cyclase